MKNIIIRATLTATCIFIVLTSYAQFSLTGEIRPRTEYRHGYKELADTNQSHAVFTDQRTRLNFDYKAEGYQLRVSLQDIRTWGSTAQLNTVDGFSSIHEAWGEAFLSDKLSFKFGRQEIIYDDHRIFGNVGWTQQARSHDAGVFKYEDSTLSVHLGIAYNQNQPQMNTTLYTMVGNYKHLQYVWLHKDFSKVFGASVLFLNNGLQAVQTDTVGNVTAYKDNYSQTAGTRLSFKKNKLAANAVFYYQTGVSGDWINTKINGILFGFDASYKLTDKLIATVGFERQSGNSQTDTTMSYKEVNHAFTPFYGTNHKFNGHMDYFYVGNHIGSVGLQDIFLKLKYKTDKFYVGADVHLFSAAADVRDVSDTTGISAMSPGLGTEIDISGGFNLSKGVAFKLGYSQMFGTETLVALKGGNTSAISNWGWAMIVIKPQLIKEKK